MFVKKIKCVCGHQFNYTSYADDQEVIDFSDMKEAAIDKINHHRRHVGHGTPTIVTDDDYNELYDVVQEHTVSCPSCLTKLPIIFYFDVSGSADIELSKTLQDRLVPLTYAPTLVFERDRYYNPVKPVVENYVYSHALSKANGRTTLQCTNTKKIKFL